MRLTSPPSSLLFAEIRIPGAFHAGIFPFFGVIFPLVKSIVKVRALKKPASPQCRLRLF